MHIKNVELSNETSCILVFRVYSLIIGQNIAITKWKFHNIATATVMTEISQQQLSCVRVLCTGTYGTNPKELDFDRAIVYTTLATSNLPFQNLMVSGFYGHVLDVIDCLGFNTYGFQPEPLRMCTTTIPSAYLA